MLKKIFNSQESKFMLFTAIKLTFIPLILFIFTGLVIWFFVRINFLFFEANGFMRIDELKSAYYDFVTADILTVIPYFFVFLIIIFFLGLYISKLVLRPFENIGEFCRNRLENKSNEPFKKNSMYRFKLLTNFSELFFTWVDDCKEEGLTKNVIPPEYKKIHAPIFEKNFFVVFIVLMFVFSFISMFAIYKVSLGVHEKIVNLAIETLRPNDAMNYFLQGQVELISEIIWITIIVTSILFLIFSLNIYGRVSGAQFAIFATMRAFMKGNYQARVHLVEYRHVRESCRYLNKYLDYISKNQ